MVSWEVMVVLSVAVIAAKVMHPFGGLITSSFVFFVLIFMHICSDLAKRSSNTPQMEGSQSVPG